MERRRTLEVARMMRDDEADIMVMLMWLRIRILVVLVWDSRIHVAFRYFVCVSSGRHHTLFSYVHTPSSNRRSGYILRIGALTCLVTESGTRNPERPIGLLRYSDIHGTCTPGNMTPP